VERRPEGSFHACWITVYNSIDPIMIHSNEYRLLDDHDFILRSDTLEEEGRRFVDLFRETFRQLTADIRERIVAFWRLSQWVFFQLADDWGNEELAQVSHGGYALRFRAEAFGCLPRKAAQWIIAHELAHVYQKVSGRAPGGICETENEAHATSLAKEWGFSPECFEIVDMIATNRGMNIKDACATGFVRQLCGDSYREN
jgi:hypothetical protein